jgi:hypothetical protein
LNVISPFLAVTQTGVESAPAAISALRAEFAETGCAMLPGFLTPGILRPLLRNLGSARYEEKHEVGARGGRFGTTLKMPLSEPALASFCFILNRQPLFDLVREITGCQAPGNYIGRIHKTTAGGEHIDWHDDVFDFREVGLNINLSALQFLGGKFLLRDREGSIRREIDVWSPGDAFLFQISSGWQHCVTPVTTGERTVGVGWFRTRPNWSLTRLSHFRSGVINLMAEPQPDLGASR